MKVLAVVLAAAAAAAAVPVEATGHAAAPKPRIVWSPIPFGSRRMDEMRRYSLRHYGIDSYRLVNPHVIVEHFTDSDSYSSAWNTFAPDVPDTELHELPGVCSHFIVDRDGTIHQLVSLALMCRHTVGLNYTAIGIEHVGTSDAEILHDRRQLAASLALTRWLEHRFHIPIRDVIGHNESLTSPYHRERVASLRHQTHDDWRHADMVVYRRFLRG
jgi:N-acetylmuramoyl-L-alanine amidase